MFTSQITSNIFSNLICLYERVTFPSKRQKPDFFRDSFIIVVSMLNQFRVVNYDLIFINLFVFEHTRARLVVARNLLYPLILNIFLFTSPNFCFFLLINLFFANCRQ